MMHQVLPRRQSFVPHQSAEPRKSDEIVAADPRSLLQTE